MGGISDVDTDYQAMVTERRYGHEEETRDGGIEGREYGLRVQYKVSPMMVAVCSSLAGRNHLNVFQSTTSAAWAKFLARCRSVL